MNNKAMLLAATLTVAGLASLLTAAHGDPPPAPPPATTNGTISFYGYSTSTDSFKISVTVSKPGRPSLVNGTPTGIDKDGIHTFPIGTTPAAVATYYAGILTNAGYTQPPANPCDFTVTDGVINFYDVSGLDGGTSSKGFSKVGGSTDSGKVPFKPADPNKPLKTIGLLRPGDTSSGTATFVAFGIGWSLTEDTISTSTSVVHIPFQASDSASAVIGKIRDAMVQAGWSVAINANGHLVISANSHGQPVYSMYQEVDYSGLTNDDHWIFKVND